MRDPDVLAGHRLPATGAVPSAVLDGVATAFGLTDDSTLFDFTRRGYQIARRP
jgi:hypothetical protein